MATNRISVQQQGDQIIVTSNDINIKQVFFGWGSWGTGSGKREYPEFYGHSIEKQTALQMAYSTNVHPDNEMWQWDLTKELVEHLYMNIMGLGSEEMEAAEHKANNDVLRALARVLNNEPPKELDSFVQAYITAALWSTLDHNAKEDERDGEFLDDNFGVDDLSEKSLEKIQQDCVLFREKAKSVLARSGMREDQAGHDFWLTRTRQGVGFQDRSYELGVDKDVCKELHTLAQSFGKCDIEVGDDGKLHFY